MDANTQKMCMEEIDHLVLDAGKKVSGKLVQNLGELFNCVL